MKRIHFFGMLVLGFFMAACNSSKDEPTDSTENGKLSIKFVYDYNMSGQNSFTQNVESVNMWIFNSNNQLVWSASVSANLPSGELTTDINLPVGNYEIVAWGGLKDNDALKLSNYKPKSKDDLTLAINTTESNSLHISDRYLSGLFYGSASFPVPASGSWTQTVTMSLVKDTNNFTINLQSLDGAAVNGSDYIVSITDNNGQYAWDNSIMRAPAVTYRPWSMTNATFNLSVGRLMDDSNPTLTVNSKVTGYDIINIPLLPYILLIKDNYAAMSIQEFLDRMDSYTIGFFLDGNGNWMSNAGVIVNGFIVR